MSKALQEQYRATPLSGTNAATIEALYERFLRDSQSVPETWRDFFSALTQGGPTPSSPTIQRSWSG